VLVTTHALCYLLSRGVRRRWWVVVTGRRGAEGDPAEDPGDRRRQCAVVEQGCNHGEGRQGAHGAGPSEAGSLQAQPAVA